MKVFRTIESWLRFRATCIDNIGFVPTLGGLHEGHAALIRRARKESDLTVLSIFLNPTQFNNSQDLANYPAVLDEDLACAEELGVDAVLVPPQEAIYPDGYRFRVDECQFSHELCGAHRLGHFTGVLTVVMKLLHLVRPARAYFGEKDYQQLSLIRDMVDAFFMDVIVVSCPTVRHPDGLALSSRNALLDAEGRQIAPKLHQMLRSKHSDAAVARTLVGMGFDVDYVVTRQGRRFAAVKIVCGEGAVRLIDNVEFEEVPSQ